MNKLDISIKQTTYFNRRSYLAGGSKKGVCEIPNYVRKVLTIYKKSNTTVTTAVAPTARILIALDGFCFLESRFETFMASKGRP